jgi:hypothetical protein
MSFLYTIYLIATIYVSQIGSFLAYVMAFVCLYIICISILSVTLRFIENIILKLLEYDHVLVLGAAGLLGVVGAVLRFGPNSGQQ